MPKFNYREKGRGRARISRESAIVIDDAMQTGCTMRSPSITLRMLQIDAMISGHAPDGHASRLKFLAEISLEHYSHSTALTEMNSAVDATTSCLCEAVDAGSAKHLLSELAAAPIF